MTGFSQIVSSQQVWTHETIATERRFNIFLYVGLLIKFEIYKNQNRRFQQYQ